MSWACFLCGQQFWKGRHTAIGHQLMLDFQYCETCYVAYKILRLLHDKRLEIGQHLDALLEPGVVGRG